MMAYRAHEASRAEDWWFEPADTSARRRGRFSAREPTSSYVAGFILVTVMLAAVVLFVLRPPVQVRAAHPGENLTPPGCVATEVVR